MHSFGLSSTQVLIRFVTFSLVFLLFSASSCQETGHTVEQVSEDPLEANAIRQPKVGVVFSKTDIDNIIKYTWADLKSKSTRSIQIPDGKEQERAIVGLAFKYDPDPKTLVRVFAIYPANNTLKGIEVGNLDKEVVIIREGQVPNPSEVWAFEFDNKIAEEDKDNIRNFSFAFFSKSQISFMTSHFPGDSSLMLAGQAIEFTEKEEVNSAVGQLFSFRLEHYPGTFQGVQATDVILDLGIPTYALGVPCPPYWHTTIHDESQNREAVKQVWRDLKNDIENGQNEKLML